ncbi:MAG: hypothetical protein KA104_00395 [Candidatus Pacebacteria bacterium]|nr:hypothetical protein [Candidatus Paceibacterota bacterium]
MNMFSKILYWLSGLGIICSGSRLVWYGIIGLIDAYQLKSLGFSSLYTTNDFNGDRIGSQLLCLMGIAIVGFGALLMEAYYRFGVYLSA